MIRPLKYLICLFKVHKYLGLPYKELHWINDFESQGILASIEVFGLCQECGLKKPIADYIFKYDAFGTMSFDEKKEVIYKRFREIEAFPVSQRG